MTILHINPKNCRPFTTNPRQAARLTPETCSDLIDSIRREGGQQIPAIVRPLGEGRWHYEVICGLRRHFAVRYLQDRRLDIPFVAEVRKMSDAEAFRLSDLENRNRVDVSDYERALSYAHALDHIYGGRQKDMAAALNVTPSWLSRYLQIARLPDEIVLAFRSPDDIRASHARRIRQLLADETKQDAALTMARSLSRFEKRLPATEVLNRLEAAACPAIAGKRKARLHRFRSSPFCPQVTLRKQGDRAVVEFPTNITVKALRGALDQILDQQAWRI